MNYRNLHSWDVTAEEAVEIQKQLGSLIGLTPLEDVRYVAGVDLAFPDKGSGVAAIVVVDITTMRVIEQVVAYEKVTFPYVPGLLAFREGPVFLKAWQQLKVPPDVVMFDGQGIAHPRRLGIASHMGLLIDLPTVGVAKSHLYGSFIEPPNVQGSYTFLYDKNEVIGAVVRTKVGNKPLFVSPGHKCDVLSALKLTLRCCVGHRLPEPTRLAHELTQKYKQATLFG
ncbi:endonuclease V [Thermotoga sp. Ku-13t]|uniref:endonuclease V n=1 Tax=Thermotoga sp. Ku-13t TaxID=1755813 RepID=UPI0013EB1609|nr:endonuclease V [Thermotoga sp. Ku-13t]KAF2957501.1 endonuclease V [Thermotoga sp. Ku-13t]